MARVFDIPDDEYRDGSVQKTAAVKTTIDTAHLQFSPFRLRDAAKIPPRDWIDRPTLCRHYVTVTVAPGGVGKSSLLTFEAVKLAGVDRFDSLGHALPRAKVWMLNLEDTDLEMELRITAACQHLGITQTDLGDRLAITTMRGSGGSSMVSFNVMRRGRNGPTIVQPVVQRLVDETKRAEVDVLIVDPFVSAHTVSENDNGEIDQVIKLFGSIASQGNCAVHLVHHTRKLNGEAATSESSRGGVAIVGGSRLTRVLNPMSVGECEEYGIDPNDRKRHFYALSDKANMVPPSDERKWFKIHSVELANGENVHAVEPWKRPSPFEGVSNEHLDSVIKEFQSKSYRKSEQSPDWGGHFVGELLDLDTGRGLTKKEQTPSQIAARAKVKKLLATWLKAGSITVERRQDEASRKTVYFFSSPKGHRT